MGYIKFSAMVTAYYLWPDQKNTFRRLTELSFNKYLLLEKKEKERKRNGVIFMRFV